MILVIAVSETHFKHWCREVGLNYQDKKSVRYIFSPDQLRGIIGRSDIEILTLPEWYLRRSFDVQEEFDLLINEHKKRKGGQHGTQRIK